MEELAKTAKFMRALRVKIQEYLHEKYPTHFTLSTTWSYVEEKIPELQDEKVLNRLRWNVGLEYIASVTTKNKKSLPFPESLKVILNQLVGLNFGVFQRDRKFPFLVIETVDLCANTLPADILDDTPFSC